MIDPHMSDLALVERLGNEIWTLLNKAEMAAWMLGWRDPANVPRSAELEWFAGAVQNLHRFKLRRTAMADIPPRPSDSKETGDG